MGEVPAGGCGLAGRLQEGRVQALPLPVGGIRVWVSPPVQAPPPHPPTQVQGRIQGTQVFSVQGARRGPEGCQREGCWCGAESGLGGQEVGLQ